MPKTGRRGAFREFLKGRNEQQLIKWRAIARFVRVTRQSRTPPETSIQDDDRQRHLDLLSQSASKHALDFLAWCLMRNHAHVVVVPCQERSLACTFRRRALQFSVKVAGNLWQERFHSYPMDERKGLGSLMKVCQALFFLNLLSSVRSD